MSRQRWYGFLPLIVLCCNADLNILPCQLQALAQTETLAMQQSCLIGILSGLKAARAELHVEQTDLMDVGLETSFKLNASDSLIAVTEASLLSLGFKIDEIGSQAREERLARCRLEYLLWAEQHQVGKLEHGYSDSIRTGLEAFEECSRLSSQVQDIWDGQGQVC